MRCKVQSRRESPCFLYGTGLLKDVVLWYTYSCTSKTATARASFLQWDSSQCSAKSMTQEKGYGDFRICTNGWTMVMTYGVFSFTSKWKLIQNSKTGNKLTLFCESPVMKVAYVLGIYPCSYFVSASKFKENSEGNVQQKGVIDLLLLASSQFSRKDSANNTGWSSSMVNLNSATLTPANSISISGFGNWHLYTPTGSAGGGFTVF